MFNFEEMHEELMEHQKSLKFELDESIKSDIDKMGTILSPDKTDRKGKLITLTWKETKGITAAEIGARLSDGLSKHKDKIKHIGAHKTDAGIVAEIELN